MRSESASEEDGEDEEFVSMHFRSVLVLVLLRPQNLTVSSSVEELSCVSVLFSVRPRAVCAFTPKLRAFGGGFYSDGEANASTQSTPAPLAADVIPGHISRRPNFV